MQRFVQLALYLGCLIVVGLVVREVPHSMKIPGLVVGVFFTYVMMHSVSNWLTKLKGDKE